MIFEINRLFIKNNIILKSENVFISFNMIYYILYKVIISTINNRE